MSNSRYLDKNSLFNSNAHPQNGINLTKGNHHDHIRVRLLKESDQLQVRELFKSAMMTGDASPFESAMKGQLKTPAAFISYFMIIFGTIMAVRSRHSMATFGFSIMALTGCILFLLYRRYLNVAFMGYLKQSFEGDLADIPKHYKLGYSGAPDEEKQALRPTAKSGFWVAELDAGGSEPTIVGCLGLDAYKTPDETIAEIRRVVVSPNHRRQGIANQLMNVAVTHGKSHGLRSLFLTTTSYQPAAMRMYQKLGWEVEGVVERSVLLEKIRVHKFHLDL